MTGSTGVTKTGPQQHVLLNLFHQAKGRYVADVDEIRPQFSLDAPDANALFASSIVRNTGLSIGDTIDKLDNEVSDIYGLHTLALPSYSDQVLPFDVTVTGAVSTARRAPRRLGVGI